MICVTSNTRKTPLTESVQRCSVAAEQLVAAEQIVGQGRKKIRGILKSYLPYFIFVPDSVHSYINMKSTSPF